MARMESDDVVSSSKKRKAPAILTLLTAIFVAVALASVKNASADPNVDAKRAQAQDVLDQIHAIDSQLEVAVEAYNLANVKLDRIKADLELNARHLTIAKSSLHNAQTHLSARLVSLYVNGGEGNALEVMLGAKSLDDLLNRMDAVERVSDQDAKVLREVTRFRAEVKQRKLRLDRARTAQAQVVGQKEAQRRWIEGQLAERQRVLSSIKSEIASLEAAEQLRQRRLEDQARARLSAQSAQGQGFATDQQVTALGAASLEATLAPAPDARYGGVVGVAMQFLGTPYVWGGASPGGFDCSGLIMYAYGQMGVSLPHHAASQYGMGVPVSRDQLQAGDLVFFNGLSHAGIYIGGGQFIHAPHSGDVVKISSLSESWYASTYYGARRL
jgi:cell wall-associated NlpC family hydrolase